MINGVLTAKLSSLDQLLTELRSLGLVSTDQLAQTWQTRRAIERNLQVLVDIVNNRLGDFEQFRNHVLAYSQRGS